MPTSINTEREYREQLLIHRGQFIRLRSDLQELTADDSERPGAANLTRLESAAQLNAIEARLESIDDAIDRLGKGEFGVCAECDGDIPPERLEVRPDALLCVTCGGIRQSE